MKYDALLKNGYVVDYHSDTEGYYDVGIKDGKIADMVQGAATSSAKEVFEMEGAVVMPGIVDPHVHVSAWLGGGAGHKMLAKAGVTSALDMSGPRESVYQLAKEFGVGINLATIEYVRPQHTVSNEDPDEKEIDELLSRILKEGSLGIKLLGGHYPLTPEATSRCIVQGGKANAYIAFHAGTLAHGSNLEGFLEAVELTRGYPLHLAHINAYCRGLIKPYMEETEIAVKTLTDNPHIMSEAYLSPLNGTSAEIVDGLPGSLVTRRCLLTGGYEATEAGMEKAIREGWAQINYRYAGETVLITGQEGVDYWRENGTDVSVSFAVNPVEPRIRLAAAKRPDGTFVVDCISTDGGGIPRNVIIPMGLALLDLGALSWKDFVRKTSYNPAQMLALVNNGSLEPGKDADITVIDTKKREAMMSFINGELCMYKGHVYGKGGRIITTKAGEDFVRSQGLEPVVVDMANRKFTR